MKKGWIVVIIIVIIVLIAMANGDNSGGLSSLNYGKSHYYNSNSGQVESIP